MVEREQMGERLQECGYSRLTSAILPYYFHVSRNLQWVITPEYNYMESTYPDYTIFLADPDYELDIKIVVEVKSKRGQSWFQLLEQMWNQADKCKDSNGKFWAVGQKGLEICVFRFNVFKFCDQEPDYFTHFKPLNLDNLSQPALDHLGVKYLCCNDHGFDRIGIIRWRLDNPRHIPYIHHMFEYMRSKIVNS